MLLQTARRRPAGGLTAYDDEYGGNTPFPHIPISYDNTGTFVEGGTLGAAQYTGTKTVYSSNNANPPYASNAGNGETLYADGWQQSSTEFVALIDTNAWTRYDSGTPREFLIGIGDLDGQSQFVRDGRYFQPDGTVRVMPANDNSIWFSGTQQALYTVDDIGITPNGILLVFFTFGQVMTQYNLVFGPTNQLTNGTAAFSILRLN